MKNNWIRVGGVVMLLLAVGILIYPVFGNWLSRNTQAELLSQYEVDMATLADYEIEEMLRRADEVNAVLSELPEDEAFMLAHMADISDDYTEIINVAGMMGQLEIPVIDLLLPIFHTTNADVLEIGVGHLEGTSFPVGGEGTHAALTAHSGLATARLFSDLEGNIDIGDLFFINILNRRLAYEVDQILIVYPHEVESLRVVPGEDFVTLITCTPYAINTHRLLVRGRRVHDTEF
ncbi:MAG: class C sortase [Defluviitaleaceae bacterium]|nr:class C sortase [Defluviitaleaceae bacterium]